MYATSDVEDALAATREFLWPFEWSKWWRLALVALFVSGGTALNPPTTETGFPTGVEGPTPPAIGPTEPVPSGELPPELLALVVVLAIGAAIVGLIFAIVGAIMEFVLVESLRNERVSIREFASRRWRQGVRLFVFNLVLGIVTVAVTGGLIALGLAPAALNGAPWLAAVALLFLVPIVLAIALLAAAAFVFTSSFVVPTMIVEDCGVLDGWRRFWPVLRESWKEYLAYALVYVALVIVTGIAAGIAVGIGSVLLLIPFGILAALGVALMSVAGVVGIAFLVVVGLLFFLAVIALTAFVQAPIVTFLRYYSLLLLGDTERDLDLVAERRAAIRSAEPAEG